MNNVSLGDLKKLIVLIPPYQEQKRISVKVDELMALCDELEKLRAKQEHKRLAANSSALNHLVTATESDDFRDAWRFISRNFSELYSVKDTVTELRKAILQLAVMGKLVQQDPKDPPASELLKEIEIEKQQLIKEKKIKASKPLPKIKPEEVPYELPKGWEWVRFGNLSEIERGGSPRPINAYLTDDPDGLNWIRIGDTEKSDKYITSAKEKIRREGLSKTRMVYPGDFLLTNSMSFGRPYITKIEGCIHDGWLRIHPPAKLERDYLYHLLSSSYVAKHFKAAAAGAVVLNLNADKVRDLPIPIPPLPEQHRIVAKVDRLMALCDTLEEKIDTANGKQAAVLGAVMSMV